MAVKQYLDLAGLQTYDGKIKTWANSANQLGYKTVLKSTDGNSLLFFKKAGATIVNPYDETLEPTEYAAWTEDVADVTINLGASDISDQLTALAAVIPATYSSGAYSITGLQTTATSSLVAAINELKANSPVALVKKATPTTGALKTYEFLQGTNTAGAGEPDTRTSLGVIDIPKDFLVKSGKIVTINGTTHEDSDGDTVAETYTDGTYIKLVINSKDDETGTGDVLYINVATLVDVYTGVVGSEISVSVDSSTNQISAAIVDVPASKITYAAAVLDTDGVTVVTPRKSVSQAIASIESDLSDIQTVQTSDINALFV